MSQTGTSTYGELPPWVTSQLLASVNGFSGALASQYECAWSFREDEHGALFWNGEVVWIGGRYEFWKISDIPLTAIPEPSAWKLLRIMAFGWSLVASWHF